MRLTDLEPQFVRYVDSNEGSPYIRPAGGNFGDPYPYPHTGIRDVGTLDESQGIQFLCPACFKTNGGPVRTHLVEVSFHDRGVLDHQGGHNRDGKPSRWAVSGHGFEDLTLTPSVDCGCWHGFVTNGAIT